MLLFEEDKRIEPDTLWKELIVSATVRECGGIGWNLQPCKLLKSTGLVLGYFLTKLGELVITHIFTNLPSFK